MNINHLLNNLPYVMQNAYGAAAAIVAANTLITEVAMRITTLVCKFFERHSELSDIPLMAIGITTLSASIAGMNVALSKLLKFPFNPWLTAGLTTLTAASYIAVRIAIANKE